jgi:hypothetical protein
MEDGQVTHPGNQDGSESLGWRAALPAEFKEHEFVKTFTKPGDFVKSALEIKAEHESLKTKLDGAIFRPGEKATAEEVEAYYRAIGKPEKASEYVFPDGDGVKHDPKMVEWAQNVFHQAGLDKDQASAIGKAWDGFVGEMAKADLAAREQAKTEAEAALKAEMGEEKYAHAAELTRRFLKEVATPEDIAFLDESKMGSHPAMIRLVFKLAQKTGDDQSPRGGNPGSTPPKVGMNYESMTDFK